MTPLQKNKQRAGLLLLRESQAKYVIGMDECGTGSWAGPATVAAVAVRKDWIPDKYVRDSKKLTRARRELLVNNYLVPPEIAESWVLHIPITEINAFGIHMATRRAFNRIADMAVSEFPDSIVVTDGDYAPHLVTPVPSIAFPRADDIVPACSAASIIGKVRRDRLMFAYNEQFPGYGFQNHVGYGTKAHIKAIQELGLTSIHRKSFKSIKKYLLSKGCV